MPVTVVLGEQRGDEGKGRFVDMLSQGQDIVARYNGGSNAGHTVVTPNGEEFDFHLLPSGIVNPEIVNVIGNGTVINPNKLIAEIEKTKSKGVAVSESNLLISSAAHLVLPHHVLFDELRESGTLAQGSTKSGIAQSYSDKYLRSGMRMESIKNDPDELRDMVIEGLAKFNEARTLLDLSKINYDNLVNEYLDNAKRLGEFVTDTVLYLNRMLENGALVLAEGAQAFQLDIDHGQYPFVTSSSTTSAGALSGLGISYKYIDRVIGVAKAVPSHVGGGPFVTEIK
ncbi:adenylosuccinate synthetase, partial [bacterium]|nr:adenylosuccinate synthetase [bacterium]